MSLSRYNLVFTVNNKVTCNMENLPANEVYSHGIPTDSLMDIEGSRWNTITRDALRKNMADMLSGDMILLAYQNPPVNPELDTEYIFVSKQ